MADSWHTLGGSAIRNVWIVCWVYYRRQISGVGRSWNMSFIPKTADPKSRKHLRFQTKHQISIGCGSFTTTRRCPAWERLLVRSFRGLEMIANSCNFIHARPSVSGLNSEIRGCLRPTKLAVCWLKLRSIRKVASAEVLVQGNRGKTDISKTPNFIWPSTVNVCLMKLLTTCYHNVFSLSQKSHTHMYSLKSSGVSSKSSGIMNKSLQLPNKARGMGPNLDL